jgi:hypothetical protein
MTRAEPPSADIGYMVTALETMICISAIAGSVRFAKAEYDQMRRAQKINRALACAVGRLSRYGAPKNPVAGSFKN